MKNETHKQVIICLLLVLVPLILGMIIAFVIHQSWQWTTAILYGLIIFFLIPDGAMFGSKLDYEAKQINPGFRPEAKRISTDRWEMIRLFSVIAAMIILFLVMFLQTR